MGVGNEEPPTPLPSNSSKHLANISIFLHCITQVSRHGLLHQQRHPSGITRGVIQCRQLPRLEGRRNLQRVAALTCKRRSVSAASSWGLWALSGPSGENLWRGWGRWDSLDHGIEPRRYWQEDGRGASLAVQWLRLQASSAGGTGSVPGQGTEIPPGVCGGHCMAKNFKINK